MKKNIKLIIILLLLIIVVIIVNRSNILNNVSPENIRDFIVSYGALAPVIYILLFTFVPLTLFPDSVLAIAGGMIFGFVGGTVYTILGAICGGTLAFFIARLIGNQFKVRETSKLKKIIDEQGFIIVLLLRLIPLFPFDVISYGAGLSRVKYKDFILATCIGIIPGVMVFSNIGTQFTNIGSTGFYLSIVLLILLLLVGNSLKRKFLSNMKEGLND